MFYNYKKSFSIVLLAVCNANYQFTLVDIGEAGRESDRGVFSNSILGYSIVNDLFEIPDPEKLDESIDFLYPYVFIGDDAFPMRSNLIKPYPRGDLVVEKLVTNYRICRARRIIENSFGILAARFRIFRLPILLKIETVESVTKACVALHNYLIADKMEDGYSIYCPHGFADTRGRPGEWREVADNDTGFVNIPRLGSNNYSRTAKEVSDRFCEYFNSRAGEVPWQYDMITVRRT